MNSDQICVLILVLIVFFFAAIGLRSHFRHAFLVNEGFTGLLYREGRLAATLAPGRYVRWGRHFRLSWLDARKTLLQVPGQEVLTADHVGVKLSVVLTTQITDPVLSVHSVDNSTTHLYSTVQTAVRSIVAGVTLEALLAQRVAIGPQLHDLVAPQAASIGVRVHAVEVRDVMLPGELRKAFSETLKARQESQATLERARGESAALRNLANAARLLEGHPSLAVLRLLQTLEASGGRQTIVMNDLAALLPMLKSSAPPRAGASPEET